MGDIKLVNKIMMMLSVTVFILSIYAQTSIRRETKVIVLDIGQGDAILIQTPQNQNILIDTGPDEAIIESLGRYLSIINRTLDLVIITHAHSDHVAGLHYLLSNTGITVEKVMASTELFTSPLGKSTLEKMTQEGVQIIKPSKGQSISFNDTDHDMLIYHPGKLDEKASSDQNNSSVVIKLRSQSDMLFMGDAEKEAESEILKNNFNLKADIIKLGHHGSKTSSTKYLLEKVHPEIGLISVGENNKFNHPSPETIDTLQMMHITSFRTDIQGDIIIYPDRQRYTETLVEFNPG